ncbi:AAA family ATPase, partial [Haloferula sp.]|uniref:AAA family ATPase n=1 Tax=Haloferula sp. TaxID=2497595 RepID=UPI003C7940F5
MAYITQELLGTAIVSLTERAHPSVIPILALSKEAGSGGFSSRSAAQTDVLDSIFSVPDNDTPLWYVPLGPSRGAKTENGRWRSPAKNYVGRSLQVMTKDLRDAGVYTVSEDEVSLAPDASDKIRAFLVKKGVEDRVPVWPFAVWRYKNEEIENIDSAVESFWSEYSLDQLSDVFDKELRPSELAEALRSSALPSEAILEKLDPLPSQISEPAEAPYSTDVEEGIASIVGAQLNSTGTIDAGGKPIQLILHGCPGSGKSFKLETYSSSVNYKFRTVIHPETRYSDFVGGLRPVTIWRVENPTPSFVGLNSTPPGDPRVVYQFVPGPLLQAYYLACFEPERSVVLIVEELSRGNPAQVFGDILQLMDRTEEGMGHVKAGASVYTIDPRPDVKAWLIENDIVTPGSDSLGKLRFPPNLFIWATMNRADQNARQLDSAFLRRWAREHCSWKQPNAAWDKIEIPYGGGKTKWGHLRSSINQRLVETGGLLEDKFIGPYFIPRSRLTNAHYLFEDLWGYLWHEVLKSRASDFFECST